MERTHLNDRLDADARPAADQIRLKREVTGRNNGGERFWDLA
jgi:hypothetical protein